MSWEDDDWEADDIAAPVAKKEEPEFADDDSSDEDEKPFVPESKPKDENKKIVSKAKSKKDVLKGGKKKASEDELDKMDPMERKKHLQTLVEEGDMALTEELFGTAEAGSASQPRTSE